MPVARSCARLFLLVEFREFGTRLEFGLFLGLDALLYKILPKHLRTPWPLTLNPYIDSKP